MNEYLIKDGEGRLWEVETDAPSDVVTNAMKFLRSSGHRHMKDVHDLLETHGYKAESNILIVPSVDFEM